MGEHLSAAVAQAAQDHWLKLLLWAVTVNIVANAAWYATLALAKRLWIRTTKETL